MAATNPIRCPECQAPVGPGTATDPYKHAIQCLHLPNEGVERLLAQYRDQDDERSKRIVTILQAAGPEE